MRNCILPRPLQGARQNVSCSMAGKDCPDACIGCEYRFLLLHCAIRVKHGQGGQVGDVIPGQGVALRQDRGPASNRTAGSLHQLLQGVEALAGGDHVIHNQDALALDQRTVVCAQVVMERTETWMGSGI